MEWRENEVTFKWIQTEASRRHTREPVSRWFLFHRLEESSSFVRFALRFFFLSFVLETSAWNALGVSDSHHYHPGGWYPENTPCARTDISFFLFVPHLFSRSPSPTNFFSLTLVLLFIATAFEAIFTSVSLPGLRLFLTLSLPALPLTCFVTHDYSLKLTPTSLLPGVYWNFIPFPTR